MPLTCMAGGEATHGVQHIRGRYKRHVHGAKVESEKVINARTA